MPFSFDGMSGCEEVLGDLGGGSTDLHHLGS